PTYTLSLHDALPICYTSGPRQVLAGGSAPLMKLLAGNSNRPLAEAIAAFLKMPLTHATVQRFADMEVFVEIHENVRGEDVFVIQSTSYPANDHLMETLVCIDALKRASARRITAVIPYFGYARQDRKPGPRTPISAKLVANLITAAGANRVLALDLHAAQIQGFFDLPVDHLNAMPTLVKYIESIRDELGPLVLVSPDVGNVKVASQFANALNADFAIIDKRRKSGAEVHSAHIIGDVSGKTALMVDDMISTAGTMCEAARLVVQHGARDVIAACTHPV